jgi:hypothetical protein
MSHGFADSRRKPLEINGQGFPSKLHYAVLIVFAFSIGARPNVTLLLFGSRAGHTAMMKQHHRVLTAPGAYLAQAGLKIVLVLQGVPT